MRKIHGVRYRFCIWSFCESFCTKIYLIQVPTFSVTLEGIWYILFTAPKHENVLLKNHDTKSEKGDIVG